MSTVSGMPTVSVVTCFRNEERFLAEAVDSVLEQTIEDWELLLVDDGSTDGSSQLARSLAASHPGRIRYLEHPQRQNLGKSMSRNLGIYSACGRYIAFLDADDSYLPDRLKRHIRVLDEMPGIDMVQSDLIHWLSWQSGTNPPGEDYVRPAVSHVDRILEPPLGLWTLIGAPGLSPGICSVTIRKDVLMELGAFEAEFRSIFEDQVLLTKMYSTRTTYVLEDYLARYRIHPNSTMERVWRSGDRALAEGRAAEREFEAWRLSYVESLAGSRPELMPVVRWLLSRSAGSAGEGGTRIGERVARILRNIGLRALPASLRTRMRLFRRSSADKRTLGGYRSVCERLPMLSSGSGSMRHAAARSDRS